jgi:polysaccharide biosynthesis transport protein
MERDERLLPLPKTTSIQVTASQETPVNYSPVYDEENFDEKRSIREYFNIVYKRLPVILALAILTTVITALYMYRQPSIYQASTQMLIEPPKPKQLQKTGFNINFGNDPKYLDTQLRLLQNPELMEKVVKRLELYKNPNLLNSENKGIGFMFRSLFSSAKPAAKESSLPILVENSDQTEQNQEVQLSPEEKALVEQYKGHLLGGLNVSPVEKTNLVNVTITSTNPDLAAKAANMLADIYREEDIQRATEGERKSYKDITNSIEELKATISRQEGERINALRRGDLPLMKGPELIADRLQTLSSQLLKATDERARLQATYNAAIQAKDSGDILAVVRENNRAITEARINNQKRKDELKKRIEDIDKEIQNAETQKKELEVRYNPEYTKVKEVAAKIDNLKRSKETIREEVSQEIKIEGKTLEESAGKEVLASLRAELQSAQQSEAKLRTDYNNELAAANRAGITQTTLTTLSREIDTGRNLLDNLIQSQKQQELAIASSMPENIKISTRAVTPGGPVGPPRNRNIMIALLMSLAAGIGLAFLLDYLDDSIKSSDDVGRYLGLPTLALIPHQAAPGKSKLGLLPVKANGIGNGNGNGNVGSSLALAALEDTRSAVAEAYRHLRTSLLFSSAGKPPQTILVTSSQPAEGKTTTAINTAVTLAQSGADVVIIDCDLRRPRLHTHFGMGNANGLTNYLSGEKSTENLLKPFEDLPKLKVITSGPIPPNPAELLSSHEMKNLLQFLKTNYKHVVIDSPPAISFTDAAILSTQVDGVVLVAMAGKSSIHLIRRFKQRLSSIGARIYGVVLNGIKSNSVDYGYYGYGYTTSYYAPDEEDDSTPLMEEIETVSPVHTTKG